MHLASTAPRSKTRNIAAMASLRDDDHLARAEISEEREEHEELRRPSPRGRPRLIRPPLTHQAATGKGAPRGNAHLSENE